MGSKFFPSCFPRGRRGRRESKGGQTAPTQETPGPGSPSEGPEPPGGRARARSTPSTSSETDPQSGRAYFSGKARVSFRHQLDSERDSTT